MSFPSFCAHTIYTCRRLMLFAVSFFIPNISSCYIGNWKEGLSSLSEENDDKSGGETKSLFLIFLYFKSLSILRESERVCVNRLPKVFGENANKEMGINSPTEFPVVPCGLSTENDSQVLRKLARRQPTLQNWDDVSRMWATRWFQTRREAARWMPVRLSNKNPMFSPQQWLSTP